MILQIDQVIVVIFRKEQGLFYDNVRVDLNRASLDWINASLFHQHEQIDLQWFDNLFRDTISINLLSYTNSMNAAIDQQPPHALSLVLSEVTLHSKTYFMENRKPKTTWDVQKDFIKTLDVPVKQRII